MSHLLQCDSLCQFEDIVSQSKNHALILDLRTPDLFAIQHATGAVNIPWCSAFCSWLGLIVLEKYPLWLVLPVGLSVNAVVEELARVGYEEVLGYCYVVNSDTGGIPLHTLTPTQLVAKGNVAILDVRTSVEWQSGHIADARHLELAALARELKNFDLEQPLAVICGSGMRSSIAASLLKRAGMRTVYNVQGGMQGWMKAGFPVVR